VDSVPWRPGRWRETGLLASNLLGVALFRPGGLARSLHARRSRGASRPDSSVSVAHPRAARRLRSPYSDVAAYGPHLRERSLDRGPGWNWWAEVAIDMDVAR
jgi:hypothetical protein